MGMGYYYPYIDPTYILVIAGALLCMLASANVNRTFQRYSRVGTKGHITGRGSRRTDFISGRGLPMFELRRISGNLTDHYDPRNKVVRLSDSVYDATSVAAVGVAAHECGHVIQHHKGYVPIKIRTAIVPIVNIGSKLSWPVILLVLS